jgi:hypothetical protein
LVHERRRERAPRQTLGRTAPSQGKIDQETRCRLPRHPRKDPPAGYSGVIAGDSAYGVTGGIFQATNATYPAPQPFPADITLIGHGQNYNSGCSFPGSYVISGTSTPFANDISYLPSTDAFGNQLDTDLLGGAGFPAATNHSGGHIVANDRQTIENAGINALDNAAQNARIDAAAK